MSCLNDFMNKIKYNEEVMKIWADIEPEVQKHIQQLIKSGKNVDEAEKMAVEIAEVLIEDAIDKQLIQVVKERTEDEATISLGEVMEKFNIDADEVLKLVNKVEID